VIGAVTGLLFILYFRFVAQEMLFFTVGTIFATSYVCDVLHAEKLLAFITAGFIVQNLSKHGHDMIEALERISLPAFVVYFTIKAAGLNLTEHTSGRQGQHGPDDQTPPRSISKRGSSRARKYLFMAAQRHIQRCPIARAWYQHKVDQHRGCKKPRKVALVAMMRKLIGALYHVGRGADYDGSKLFDVQRLVDKGYLPAD